MLMLPDLPYIVEVLVGGKRSNNMNFSVVASNNHIIVDEPLAIFQP